MLEGFSFPSSRGAARDLLSCKMLRFGQHDEVSLPLNVRSNLYVRLLKVDSLYGYPNQDRDVRSNPSDPWLSP